MFSTVTTSDTGGGSPGERDRTLLARIVGRVGYTGRHRARPAVARHSYGELTDMPYVSVEELLSHER
ncbi:hypothetical protein HNR73_003950 [Phytomonospora endophytica]|uniref:Uncharacterized protein n=1 Tax=Phytomonospora endophytica TaxID=714109 RepID=A0A841FRA5_9ACTN|nr:hypothetical protein [Phytomonospora endophytica]GIG66987.1 hypothetical protein Pen01_32820 [Phytomonospora endophytica]